MSNPRRGKKENNRKSYGAHEAFLKHQRANRPKQVWVVDAHEFHGTQGTEGAADMGTGVGTAPGHWEKQ